MIYADPFGSLLAGEMKRREQDLATLEFIRQVQRDRAMVETARLEREQRDRLAQLEVNSREKIEQARLTQDQNQFDVTSRLQRDQFDQSSRIQNNAEQRAAELFPSQKEQAQLSVDTGKFTLQNEKELAPIRKEAAQLGVDTNRFSLETNKSLAPVQLDAAKLGVDAAKQQIEFDRQYNPVRIQQARAEIGAIGQRIANDNAQIKLGQDRLALDREQLKVTEANNSLDYYLGKLALDAKGSATDKPPTLSERASALRAITDANKEGIIDDAQTAAAISELGLEIPAAVAPAAAAPSLTRVPVGPNAGAAAGGTTLTPGQRAPGASPPAPPPLTPRTALPSETMRSAEDIVMSDFGSAANPTGPSPGMSRRAANLLGNLRGDAPVDASPENIAAALILLNDQSFAEVNRRRVAQWLNSIGYVPPSGRK